MSNMKKLVGEMKAEPTRFYRQPHDVLRDRRLTPDDRIEILDAWREIERQAGHGQLADQIALIKDQAVLAKGAQTAARA